MRTNKLNIKFIQGNRAFMLSALTIIVATLVSIHNLDFYLRFDFNFTLSLILVPFVLYVKHGNNLSIRFGIVSLLFLCLYPILKVQSFYFFGFSFFLLFAIESNLGKLNNLPVFLLFLLSPVAIFAIEVFGFPIRLWLTDASTQIISFVNEGVSSKGNLILINGDKFTVDPECMGLKMVITGYLITLVIISWFERRSKKELSFFKIIIILFLASILIIISNLFRIIGIIFAKAAPETNLHELIGIISLIIYVIVPVYFIIKLFYKKFSKPISQGIESEVELSTSPVKMHLLKKTIYFRKLNIWKISSIVLTIMLMGFLGFLNFNRENYRTLPGEINPRSIEIEGYQCNILENGVAQLTSDSALIYIKQIPNFYSADHTPMVCWKGSGYQLQNQQKIEITGKEIYFAELTLENSKPLYTAWWYSNNNHITISQLDWRWRLIKGEDNFSLVNVTCENQSLLTKEIKQLFYK